MNLSTFVQVIDPEAFSGLEAFKEEMTFLSQQCLNNEPIDKNNKVRMPGEKALLRRDKSIKNGISLNQDIINTLEKLAEKFKINL